MAVAPISVPPGLALVLNSAGDKSNVDFDYLVQTAMRESSLNPEAKASGSSAVGLFQFLESTWLQVLKEQGPRLGYGEYADAISRTSDGDYTVKNKAQRAEILKLREDPQMAADLAAAFTQSNGAYLESKFGRMPSAGELYIAHFLGPQGAEKLFNAGLKNPDQIAANIFPKQAKANRQIFYAGDHARTIKEVYRALVAKHVGAPAVDPAFATQQLANATEDSPAVDPLQGAFRWPVEAPAWRTNGDTPSPLVALFLDAPRVPETITLPGLAPNPPPLPDPSPLPAPMPLEERPIALAKSPIAVAETPIAALDATAAVEALAGIAEPAELMGYVPLPAPPPLIAPGETLLASAVAGTPVPPPQLADDIPKPRVLMSRHPATDGNAFLAQLYGN